MTTKSDPKGTRSMEERLSEVGRRIDGLLSNVRESGDLRHALDAELDVLRQWRDELHLHAELAGMELRDVLEPTIEKVDLAVDRALDRVDELFVSADVDDEDLRESVKKEMKGLRQELDAATESYGIV